MRSRVPRNDTLRIFLEAALDAVVVMKSDGTVVEWNEQATELFGWPREEAVGLDMAALILPERYREGPSRGLQRFLETGQGPLLGKRIELTGLRRSGEEFPVEIKISPINDRRGIAFVGCLRDISLSRTVEAQLAVSERQFGALVQAITDYAIYMLDPQGRVTSWNRGAERIKGYGAEEIVGNTSPASIRRKTSATMCRCALSARPLTTASSRARDSVSARTAAVFWRGW